MSRKLQIHALVKERPRTTAELATALGAKTSTMTVAVAAAASLGLIKPVGKVPHPRRPGGVTLWGPT